MAFTDELQIHISAGDGGDGVVRWRREKFRPKGGPSGGNGGKGGDVYVRAVRDIGLLGSYKHKKSFEAEDGEAGLKDSKYGKNGDDLIIDFPVGSFIKNLSTGNVVDLSHEGQTERILDGGNGGYGNEHFKSSTNQRPREFTKGKPGEEADFYIELQLIVDAGLIGYPNAGKSTLLNSLTNASAKVGSYAFTTLEPNLGDFYGYILADIPGLIEGASEGKGLGYTFLRHIRRTKALIHCVSLEHEDVEKTYKEIRAELEKYHPSLTQKPEMIVLTKADEVDQETAKKAQDKLSRYSDHIEVVTVLDDDTVKNFQDSLTTFLEKIATASS